MAYGGSGYGSGGSVFGGFTGGYSITPEGQVVSSGIGSNLPSVNPNTYQGTVHFGPPTTFVGGPTASYPGAGPIIDPNLVGVAPLPGVSAANNPAYGAPVANNPAYGAPVPGAYPGQPY